MAGRHERGSHAVRGGRTCSHLVAVGNGRTKPRDHARVGDDIPGKSSEAPGPWLVAAPASVMGDGIPGRQVTDTFAAAAPDPL